MGLVVVVGGLIGEDHDQPGRVAALDDRPVVGAACPSSRSERLVVVERLDASAKERPLIVRQSGRSQK